MQVIKHCPHCNSTRISGNISIENGEWVQSIGCKKCGYSNHRVIGNAEKKQGI